MTFRYLPVIGLEVHAELLTRTKMFCNCPVVDVTHIEPNNSICPICTGMPGTLPVINQAAVQLAVRVALALNCTIAPFSLFERKNYFYPDLPKGYQISQYEYPLATGGSLSLAVNNQNEVIHIRRVHLEEDTGKLIHIKDGKETYSLVDYNRAGIALLEIVSEPELYSLEAVRAYATTLRSILRYLGACSGDMEKGAIRFEANISMNKSNTKKLGTRVEIKNLNSFRAMEHAIKYEIGRQTKLIQSGKPVAQETVGWDDINNQTISQRFKEEANDYRYFAEPDLPPLIVDDVWLKECKAGLPELPTTKREKYIRKYGLGVRLASLLCEDPDIADYFEKALACDDSLSPQLIANWITGDVFAYLNQYKIAITSISVNPADLVNIIHQVENGTISRINAKRILTETLHTGRPAEQIIKGDSLGIIRNMDELVLLAKQIIDQSQVEFENYRAGKKNLIEWFVGQAMQRSHGRADPQRLRKIIENILENPDKN